MQKLLKKIGLMILLLLLCLAFFSIFDMKIVKNQYEGNYQSAVRDKIHLVEETKSPKIILVGNSNVAFGFYSPLIEEAFGMPVVNLGQHGGLGNAFLENMAKTGINEGDLIIVCHSNYSDDNTIGDYGLAWITVETDLSMLSLLEKEDYVNMALAYPKYAFNASLLWIRGVGNRVDPYTCYSRTAFNEHGDIVYRDSDTMYKFKDGDITVPEINDICIKRLNKLNRYCVERGATMLIAGYPIADGEYTPDKEEYIVFEKELDSKVDAEIISDFTDYFFPYEDFYNTYLHMSESGAKARTKQLILDLEKWGLGR